MVAEPLIEAGQVELVIEQVTERVLEGAGEQLLGKITGRNFGDLSITL